MKPYLSLYALMLLGIVSGSTGEQDHDGFEIAFREDFLTTAGRDDARTSASWGTTWPGALQPGKGGGSGCLGDLILTSGQTMLIDTAQHTFAADTTMVGFPVTVTDGSYHFSSVKIEPGATLRFTGSSPVRIYTAAADIQGTIDVSGEDAPLHHSLNDPCPVYPTRPWISNNTARGGHGGEGGPGGGKGGSGGDDPRPIGLPPGGMPSNPGGPSRLAPEHLDGEPGQGLGGQGGAAQGGGGGSPVFPVTSVTADPVSRVANIVLLAVICYSVQKAGGGGGGSYGSSGQPGRMSPPQSGQGGLPGSMLSFDPSIPPATARGGAGGGGGGVHCYFSNSIVSRLVNCTARYPSGSRPHGPCSGREMVEVWNTGCGGGGGGGYLYLQCGADLDLPGRILARGGQGGSAASFGSSTPQTESGAGGGGGSGGAIRVDVGGAMQLGRNQNLDVSGGSGGGSSLRTVGGNGGYGAVHVRSDPAPGSIASSVDPPGAETTARYVESDYRPRSTAVSRFREVAAAGTNFDYVDLLLTFAIRRAGAPMPADPLNPRHVFYITLPASDFLDFAGPLYVSYQGESGDAAGHPIPGTRTPWTLDIESLRASANRLRYAIVLDRRWFEPLTPLVAITRAELLIHKP